MTAWTLGLSMLAAPALAHADGEASDDAPATREVAGVQVQLRTGEQSIASWTQDVDWGATAQLSQSVDGHAHDVKVAVTKLGAAGKKLRVKVGYVRDGESVLDEVTINCSAARCETVRRAAGVAIALTIEPKTVPNEPVHRIDAETDTNDPLAGI